MIRCPLVLEHLKWDEDKGELVYAARPAKATGPFGGVLRWDVLEFIARITDHIPELGQQLIRNWGYYSNASRGKRRGDASIESLPDREGTDIEEQDADGWRRRRKLTWAKLIQKVYEDGKDQVKSTGSNPFLWQNSAWPIAQSDTQASDSSRRFAMPTGNIKAGDRRSATFLSTCSTGAWAMPSIPMASRSLGSREWNPIEHRLFSEISKNWAGRPLDSYETILNYIRTTRTKTGLKVSARFVKKKYAKGIIISNEAMAELNINQPTSLPKWNYTLRPFKNGK